MIYRTVVTQCTELEERKVPESRKGHTGDFKVISNDLYFKLCGGYMGFCMFFCSLYTHHT